MRLRIAIIGGAITAAVILLGLPVWRTSRDDATADVQENWERDATRWRVRAAEALEQKVSPATSAVLGELLADAQRLRREKPAGAHESEFRFMVVRVEAFSERVKNVDWEEVIKWERDVQLVGETLRRALAEPKYPDEDRSAAIRAAEVRLQELRTTRPWCADDEPAEEVRRMISAARANLPPGRR